MSESVSDKSISKNDSQVNKFSISEQDSSYQNAVDEGNSEQAQRLVDNAAMRWSAYSVDGNVCIEHRNNGREFKDITKIKEVDAGDVASKGSHKSSTSNSSISNPDKNVNKFSLSEADTQYKNAAENGKPYKTEYTDTRVFAKYAHQMGYDGVVFKNIVDNGGAIYEIDDDLKAAEYIIVAFNPENVKSADAVTYNEDGEVIPLSSRFSDSKDIRYSKSEKSLAKGRRSYYNEFTTNAMQWAHSAATKVGDTKVLNRNGREYVLIEATEDGYIEIANGNYEKVRAINEQAYRDAAISSRVLTERIRIESGRDRWSAFDDDEREYGARNRGQARRAGLQDDTSGDAEHLRSGHQETSDDITFSRS